MPRGDKSSYTAKQRRKAEHIEESYEKQGMSEDEAERRAWATVNKQSTRGKSKTAAKKNRVSAAKKGGQARKKSATKKSTAKRSR